MITNKNTSQNKVVVVDLDGTLYSINTFRYFIKYLVGFSISKLDLKLLLNLCHAIVFRGLGFINHSKMKYLILNAIKGNDKIKYHKFVTSIDKYKRSLQPLEDSTYAITILATAAPFCYASIIAKNENFTSCLATPFPESEFTEQFENVGENKKAAVLDYLQTIDRNEVETILTDHHDDLPLIKIVKQVILVNPSKETKNRLTENQILFNIVA